MGTTTAKSRGHGELNTREKPITLEIVACKGEKSSRLPNGMLCVENSSTRDNHEYFKPKIDQVATITTIPDSFEFFKE
jgi:hypothetical protein